MKYFGFIKEHDDEDYAISIKNLIGENNTENPQRKNVLEYLRKGELCVAWMGCVENANDPNFDTDEYEYDNFIAYMSIYTDGKWFWPKYIITYLEKYPTMRIGDEFVNYVLNSKNDEIKLSKNEIHNLEMEYSKKTGLKKE